MLHIAHIRENRQAVIDALKKRNIDATAVVDEVLTVDEERRSTQQALDGNLAEAKKVAAEIGMLFKQGKTDEANAARARTGDLKQLNQELDGKLKELESKMTSLLSSIPNTPHESVPAGKDSEDNEIVRTHGEATPISTQDPTLGIDHPLWPHRFRNGRQNHRRRVPHLHGQRGQATTRPHPILPG